MAWDEKIHKALAHPIRRRIIEGLQERNELSFDALLKQVGVSNHGKLGFHIRALTGLVEHEPSTRTYRLTALGRLAGELVWETRLLIARQRLDLEHEPRRYVRYLRLGDHAVLFYDTDDEKRDRVFPFLLAGLLKGEAVVYAASESKLGSESLAVQRYGINVDDYGEGAFAIISADEWYLRKGEARAETIMANWLTILKEKQKVGFAGLRVAGDTDVFIANAKSQELLRYDVMLGRQLPPTICALCSYDTHVLDEELFTQINKSHGHSIFKGIGLKTI